MELSTRNVNTAFARLVHCFFSGFGPIETGPSRNGEVAYYDEPVLVTYRRPWERVLFNAARDANPFFHLYEALWMLAGRNDVQSLARYNKRMLQYSDDGTTLRGAYGYRWRKALAYNGTKFYDQLDILVDHLQKNPFSRRAVLQMWSVQDDLLWVERSLDVCCNTHAYLSVESGVCPECAGKDSSSVETCPRCKGKPHDVPAYLNLTVCNRSNDLIWGTLGANAVHFSFLQEYLAARLGLKVGVYNQFTNNLHVYLDNWKPLEWLEEYQIGGAKSDEWYGTSNWNFVPLVQDPVVFEKELPHFVEVFSGEVFDTEKLQWKEPFLRYVAFPLLLAYQHYKRGSATSLLWTRNIEADDWKIAARNWIERRLQAKKKKEEIP
jgi:thymidylate synthase